MALLHIPCSTPTAPPFSVDTAFIHRFHKPPLHPTPHTAFPDPHT
jgi:hypothetical protein